MVAIPTLAAGAPLRECLDSLSAQAMKNFRVVVVDNSGCGLVRLNGDAERSGATVLEMARNVGFGEAVNRAWEAYPSPLVATLNDDAVASPQWLGSLVRAAENYQDAGMFASRVMLSGTQLLDSAGMLICADGSSKQRGHREPVASFSQPDEALFPSGSAALYRSAMLRDAGAFDPHFFLYCEDTDLGLRAQRTGWTCRYVPDAQVSHRYSHSAGQASALKAYYVERNRLFLVVKNFPFSRLLAAPFVSFVRYVWHAVFLFQGQGSAAKFATESGAGWRLPWFVAKAHFALLRSLPRLLRQRRALDSILFRDLLSRFSISPRRMAEY